MNPFKKDTQIYRVFEVLKDLEWHCSECELPGSQPAKALQMIRQAGFEMEKNGSNWERRIYCEKCKRKTPHRKLVSLERQNEAITRVGFSAELAQKIINHYGGKDEFLGYSPTGIKIEIDHRIPQVRWSESEEELYEDADESEIEQRYMLLVREHNLLKSRHCERCVATNIRQPFLQIDFFYQGNSKYESKIGCVGCGWHHPAKWREELNKVLKNQKQ